MVIQPIMSSSAIVKVWEETKEVFERNHIALSERPLEDTVHPDVLSLLLDELNVRVGSSAATCTEGG